MFTTTRLAGLRTKLGRTTSPVDPTMPTPPDGAVIAPAPPVKAAVFRHLLTRDDGTADTGLWAYYLLPGIDHQFITAATAERVYGDHVFRWANLAGRRIWLRGTQNPFPVDAYGEHLTKDPGRPVPEGTRTWADLVDDAQEMIRLSDAKAPLTVLGVRVSPTPVSADLLHWVAGSGPIPDEHTNLNDVRRELTSVTEIVGREGFNARPLTGAALQWLVHTSRGLGCPVPPVVTDRNGDRDWENITGFTGGVYATAGEFAPTVNVRTMRGLTVYDRHVVVQPAERFDPRDVTDRNIPPWLSWAVALDEPGIGPVDYVMVGEIKTGDDLISSAEFTRRKAQSEADNWAEVGERIPAALFRAIERASEIEDEVTTGSTEIAARFAGVVLFAVSGDSEGDALDRASQLRSHMGRVQRIGLTDSTAQYALYRAFTPGAPETADPAVTMGRRTRQPLYYLATAVPNAYATAGDRLGMPLGPVGGANDVFVYDPHAGPARNESGLSAFIGQQGAGKSALVGALIDWSAAQGVRNVFTDPSGQMRRLCELPWNRGDAYVFDLAKASEGVAVPSLLIPEPHQSDYTGGGAYARAVKDAREARKDTTIDVFREMLPHALVMSEAGAEVMTAIEDAVGEYGADYGADPWDIVARLDELGEPGQHAARLLRVRGTGSVFFPKKGTEVDATRLEEQFGKAVLTGISLEGVAVPEPGTPRQLWTRDQQRSAPLLLVASLLAMRTMYADRGPKQITMDEIGIQAAGGQGASPVLLRAAAESRKWGATVNVVGQTPAMFTNLGVQVSSLLGFTAVGMMDDVGDGPGEALKLLGLGEEHAVTLASLRRGEFLIRRPVYTGTQRSTMVRRVYIDRSWWREELLAALDTTPGGEGSYVDDLGADLGVFVS